MLNDQSWWSIRINNASGSMITDPPVILPPPAGNSTSDSTAPPAAQATWWSPPSESRSLVSSRRFHGVLSTAYGSKWWEAKPWMWNRWKPQKDHLRYHLSVAIRPIWSWFTLIFDPQLLLWLPCFRPFPVRLTDFGPSLRLIMVTDNGWLSQWMMLNHR